MRITKTKVISNIDPTHQGLVQTEYGWLHPVMHLVGEFVVPQPGQIIEVIEGEYYHAIHCQGR